MRFEVDFGFDIYKSGFGEKLGEKLTRPRKKSQPLILKVGVPNLKNDLGEIKKCERDLDL